MTAEKPVPTRGKRCAAVPVDSLPIESYAAAPYVGRRRAAVPVEATTDLLPASPYEPLVETALDAAVHTPLDATPLDTALDTTSIERVLSALEPVDHTTSFEHEPTAQLPLLRYEPQTQPAGKRRAPKRGGGRGPLVRGLPSAPVLAGVAALAVAVGGAALVDDGDSPATSTHTTIAAAGALTGTSGQASVGGRGQTVTRDSDRTADAPDRAAQAAANGQVEARNKALNKLTTDADAQAKEAAANRWIYPLEPVILTARFGQYGLWANFHTGLDFNGETGDPIHAIADGTVTFTGYDGSYGNKTIVTLADGTELWYCHQSAYEVSLGDHVKQGQVIGLVGATGNVTGSHLHVEVRPGGGDPVDPYPAMQQHGLFLGSEAQPG